MQMSIFDGTQPFKITKPIRLIELFSGYGSQALALKYLGVPFEHHRIAEWAVKSIQAYKDLHFGEDNTDYSATLSKEEIVDFLFKRGISSNYNEPMTYEQIKRLGEEKARQVYNNIMATHNLVSVCNAKGEDFGIIDTDKYTYIMTYSFPCFTADSLVMTANGYNRIADIKVGDSVLSHDNLFHSVVNTFDNGTHDLLSIKAMGVDEIKATPNHKFYVRTMRRVGHYAIRTFGKPYWKEASELTTKDYIGIAINQNSNLPKWEGVDYVWSDGRKPRHKNELQEKMQNTDFWWVLGRYIGDGWFRTQGGIIICCAKDKTEEITSKLNGLFGYNIVEERTVNKIHICDKELSAYCEQFGKGASNKKLTQDIFDLPIEHLSAFLDGYFSADGCFTQKVFKATSVSRELIYGIAQCVAKAYKVPYRVYKTERKATCTIEGRVCNQKNTYSVVFKKDTRKQDHAFYENGYLWQPIQSIKEIAPENVYDIEVEGSHSFTVQNTIVHNCQDLSNAGKGAGMAKDSGTRSGLLWQVERILLELHRGGNHYRKYC